MKVKQVDLSLIKPPAQPIRDSLGDLTGLIESISNEGLLQPVKLQVTKKSGHRVTEYEVIFGNRRVEATRRAGFKTIAAIVITDPYHESVSLSEALTENVQRADMSPLEKAHALKRLMDLEDWTMTDVAKAGIMPRKTAAGYLALLKLPEDVQSMITKDMGGRGQDRRTKPLTVEHVSKAAPAGKHKEQVLRKAARENLTSRQTHLVAKTVRVAIDHKDEARIKSLIDTYEYSDRLFDPAREAKRYGPIVTDEDLSADADDKTPEPEASDCERIYNLICKLSNSAQIIQFAIEGAELTNDERERIKEHLDNLSSAIKKMSKGLGNLEIH